MRTAVRRAVLALAAVAAMAMSPAVQAAPPVVVPAPVVPAPSFCWIDVRLFQTLRHGPVPFCRRRLRYRPGALECYQFTDQVCATYFPGSGYVTSRGAIDVQVFTCPAGPEPPVCRQLDLPALP